MRESISNDVFQRLLEVSRYQCLICGSKDFLQVAHITPVATDGTSDAENMLVICPTCHMGVDGSGASVELLKEIKSDWIEKGILGKYKIEKAVQSGLKVLNGASPSGLGSSFVDLINWSEALKESDKFDTLVKSIVQQLNHVNLEDDFISNILKPVFDAMGYEGVVRLHHTGRPEYGKDIVFYERDRLGGFTYYAVVACVGKIHAASAKTNSSGHYKKIIDQVEKCFNMPYEDHNAKGEFYVDKVIVACSGNITEYNWPQKLDHMLR